ncbi:MAG: VWA domain-containing protein [Bacteroidota bacterium]
MSFRSPLVLALAVMLVPAGLAAFAYAARRRTEALRLFLGPRADRQPSRASLARQRWIRGVLLASAAGLLAVALAGPRFGTAVREGRQESLDLIIALDVSDSMRAEDVAPSRLERAKLEIGRVVEARRGDRIGLVVFAGEAFLQCPLTTDRGALRLFLDAADPSQVSVQGTDYVRAGIVVRQAFDATDEEEPRPRALLIVSDGEDHEGDLDEQADYLQDRGIEIFALGVGTDEGGPVPDVRRGRTLGPRLDRRGEPIITRYEAAALEEIAGGNVFRAERRPAAPAINEALDRLDRAVVAQDEFAASAERFQWPLALALLLLLAERVIALRPPTSRPAGGPKSGEAPGENADASAPSLTVASLLALLLLGGCRPDAIQPGAVEGRRGVAALDAGDLARAEAQFVSGIATPDVPRPLRARLWHGLGVTRMRAERTAEADSAFAEALARADTPRQRGRYAYDAGTAALTAGDAVRADSLLRLALLLAPTPDARRNQEIARRLIEDPPPQPEPSDFAEQLKAQADSLVQARQYREALDVMQGGLAQDSSVAAYADFVQRLDGVVQIEEGVPQP